MTDVLVVSELQAGLLRKTTLSAATCAKQVAQATGGAFDILVLGAGCAEAARQAGGFGARKVIVADDAYLKDYVAERFAPTVAAAVRKGGYGLVVATASPYGKDLMPRVAAQLGAGQASDVSTAVVEGGKVQFRRATWAGNVVATVEIATPVGCVTVRQAEFDAAPPSGGASATEKIGIEKDPVADNIEFVGLEITKSERPELTEARVVVAGGRGMKSAENFKLLDPLLDLLGAALGASRAAVDAGFVPNDLQIGQTGKVVGPELYIAIAISGAIQHLAGMKGSKVIVAINKDAEAPIFQVADYGLVADLFKAVPEMVEELKKLKAQQ